METVINMSARSLQYYVIGKHWASDLEFFRIETAFLHRLMDDYFARLLDETDVKQLSNTGMKLYQLEKDEARVSHMLSAQLKQLELMAEDSIPENTEELAGTQVHLENLVTTAMFEYRAVKNEIFELIEQVMKTTRQ
jgi:3-hydroxyacyl-CoA dehydrogenase